MLLWIAFALMTAAALVAVLRPLARPAREPSPPPAAGALAVYRQQLEEIEAERARGLVDDKEAAAAKTEVSRRLLASADELDRAPHAGNSIHHSRRGVVALATAAVVPLLTLALYLAYGSPGLPSFPASNRDQLSLEGAQVGDLVAKVEARLREHPEDGDGWDVIAPVYYKLGRFHDAANAYARAARLKGETVRRLAGFAEVRGVRCRRHRHRGGTGGLREDPEARAGPRRAALLAGACQGAGRQARRGAGRLQRPVGRGAGGGALASRGRGPHCRRLAPCGGRGTRDPRGPGPSAEDVAAAEKLSPRTAPA